MPTRLPIRTEKLTIIAAGYEPALKSRETGEIQTDRETGKPMNTVHLTVFIPGEVKPQVWSVKVVGEPKGVVQGHPVQVAELFAADWENENRHGIRFWADSITPSGSATKQAA